MSFRFDCIRVLGIRPAYDANALDADFARANLNDYGHELGIRYDIEGDNLYYQSVGLA